MYLGNEVGSKMEFRNRRVDLTKDRYEVYQIWSYISPGGISTDLPNAPHSKVTA